jgi:hypothetical protein
MPLFTLGGQPEKLQGDSPPKEFLGCILLALTPTHMLPFSAHLWAPEKLFLSDRILFLIFITNEMLIHNHLLLHIDFLKVLTKNCNAF